MSVLTWYGQHPWLGTFLIFIALHVLQLLLDFVRKTINGEAVIVKEDSDHDNEEGNDDDDSDGEPPDEPPDVIETRRVRVVRNTSIVPHRETADRA